jgi:hypothetical protein
MRLVLLAPGFNPDPAAGGASPRLYMAVAIQLIFTHSARELAYALGSCKIQSRLALSTCKMQLSGGPDKIGLISQELDHEQ